MDKPLLAVTDLQKIFSLRGSKDVVHAVNGVSFQIQKGEALGLVGESGSGKTTVGRCVLRLIEPTDGKILFRDADLTKLKEAELRKIRPSMQMIFQEPFDSLNPRMTGGQIVDEPLLLEKKLSAPERKERVAELFEMVGVRADRRQLYPHQLSGSEQQRIGIARAIATSPDLVVLDEPTSTLDISVRAEIIDLFIRLQQELGLAYLFISHDISAVREISDRVAIMYLGKIVEVASREDIFESQYHPYGQALLSSVLYPDPQAPPGSTTLTGEIPSPIDLPSGCTFHPRCPIAISKCASESPPLEPHDNRLVACWRAGDSIHEVEQ